jgi:choline kinase
MIELSLLYMAGGRSSRFGGEPKFLAKIGKDNETLFEYSVNQIRKHIKINHVHIIVNKDNNIDILNEAKRIKCKYDLLFEITSNIQEIPEYRSKPWGTGEAASSAWEYMKRPFLLLNSDDLYDEKTFEQIDRECDTNKNYIIGFELGKTLKNNNKANRAFIHSEDNQVLHLKEQLNIERMTYTEDELKRIIVSVNLFLLQPSVLMNMVNISDKFKLNYKDNNLLEALLPDFINDIIRNGKMKLNIVTSSGEWNGITFKNDIEKIKKDLDIL